MPRLKLIEMDSLNKMIYFRKDDKLIAFDADVAIELISDSLDGKNAPVRHGHWEKPQRHGVITYDEHAYAECSCCHKPQYLARGMNYCPNCGAKMDEVEE